MMRKQPNTWISKIQVAIPEILHDRIGVPCCIGSGINFFIHNPIQQTNNTNIQTSHDKTSISLASKPGMAQNTALNILHGVVWILLAPTYPTWFIFAMAGCMNGRGLLGVFHKCLRQPVWKKHGPRMLWQHFCIGSHLSCGWRNLGDRRYQPRSPQNGGVRWL